MSEPSRKPASALFREEAIDHHLRLGDGGTLLDPSPLWTWTVFFVSSVLVASVLLFLFLAEVDPQLPVAGRLVHDNGTWRVVAGLPPAVTVSVRAGDRVRVALSADSSVAGTVSGIGAQSADPACLAAAPRTVVTIRLDDAPGGSTTPDMPVTVPLPLGRRRLMDTLVAALHER